MINRKFTLALLVLGLFLIGGKAYALENPIHTDCTFSDNGTFPTGSSCDGYNWLPSLPNFPGKISIDGHYAVVTIGSECYYPDFIVFGQTSTYFDSDPESSTWGQATNNTIIYRNNSLWGTNGPNQNTYDLSFYTNFDPEVYTTFQLYLACDYQDTGTLVNINEMYVPEISATVSTSTMPVTDNHFVIVAGFFLATACMWLIISLFKKRI